MADFTPSRQTVTVDGISVTTFFKDGALLAAPASPTVNIIVTQVYSAGVFENVSLIQASATNYAKYFFKINGVIRSTKRSGPDYNIDFDFTGAPFALSPGDIVTVEAQHTSGTIDYEATIFGYA